ncbi:hypothetical protein LTR70_004701 [Exophiala xenobiotica]|uniref:Peptidase S8/S53 domain-containing protein n=1 Tax=Lithohypha guttulata TaxID=1690604 RepID=A0ABR0KCH2_9EURO|nr:hypothetical protein LTR24_004317 [Lithohypha guttulata]KAK5319917.1 hypothetical protein LTR70_004701 [Exophiala xenobiotica]
MSEDIMASSSQSPSEKAAPIPISINGNVVDPKDPTVRALSFGVGDTARSDHILVQAAKYLTKDNKEELARLKIQIEELVSDKTYLCRFEGEKKDLGAVRRLPFVTWANVYGSQFVVSSDLTPTSQNAWSGAREASASDAHEVDVVFHESHGQSKDKLVEAVAKAAHVHSSTLEAREDMLRLVLQDRYFGAVARLDAVRSILPVVENKLYNNIARNILFGYDENIGARTLEEDTNIKIGDFDLRGQGEIVAVADTGIDDGHTAFKGRIVAKQGFARSATDDPDGHGTHVCGSVLGDGQYKSATKAFRVQGTAPEARLVMQSIGDDEGNLIGIPADVGELFQEAYDLDARVHNNSWGSKISGLPYGTAGRQIDKFVRSNPDMVICFAGGNEGVDIDRNGIVDLKQIGRYAAAKNSITVGASESYRPEGPIEWGMFPEYVNGPAKFKTNPIRSDLTANNSSGMAAFSNRGPSKEGRIKPDIVAPGTFILSARSKLLGPARRGWGVPDDPEWWYQGGTSMASPLVAGGCAVMRQALRKDLEDRGFSQEDVKNHNFSAALIKALLINGAVELKGQYFPSEAGPSPNFSSGWGRVNLKESVEMAKLREDDDSSTVGCYQSCHLGKALGDDGVYTHEILIDASTRTLKNHLALLVTVGNKKEFGNSTADCKNNVEQVAWPNTPSGTAKIIVTVKHLAKFRDTQDFALAWKLY